MTERPPAEDELMVDDGDEGAGEAPKLDLPLEFDLDPAGASGEATPRPGGDQRARFVAEGPPLGSDGRVAPEADDDDPTVAFRPLGPDDRDAHSTVRLRRSPPALPPSLRPPEPTPKVLLGPGLSTRNEITERMQLIPKTHPMANSIAPGGSALTLTPPPKRASRGLFAAGAAALLALGVGAAHYLQSRGEHHAATERDGPSSPRAAASPVVDTPDEASAPRPPAPAAAASAGTSADIVRAAPQAPTPNTPDTPDTAARAAARTTAQAARGSPASSLPITAKLGDAALRPGQRPFRPSLGAITTAVEGVRDRVRACAGEAHGIADVVLRVQASGVVSHAQVHSGPFADSPAGSCIAKAMRKARVAPFRKPVAHILYTLKL